MIGHTTGTLRCKMRQNRKNVLQIISNYLRLSYLITCSVDFFRRWMDKIDV
jgi:hypothetical protein